MSMVILQYLILEVQEKRKLVEELEILRVIKNKELFYGEIMEEKSFLVMRMDVSLSGIRKKDQHSMF
jgi:hypothetical protein